LDWGGGAEVAGGWRTPHNEELQYVYASLNVITVFKSGEVRWAGHVACMGEVRNSYNILVEKSEKKRPLGRPRRRC
jgi:hypothetical protein